MNTRVKKFGINKVTKSFAESLIVQDIRLENASQSIKFFIENKCWYFDIFTVYNRLSHLMQIYSMSHNNDVLFQMI